MFAVVTIISPVLTSYSNENLSQLKMELFRACRLVCKGDLCEVQRVCIIRETQIFALLTYNVKVPLSVLYILRIMALLLYVRTCLFTSKINLLPFCISILASGLFRNK